MEELNKELSFRIDEFILSKISEKEENKIKFFLDILGEKYLILSENNKNSLEFKELDDFFQES